MKQFKTLTPEQKEYYFIQSTTKAVAATKSRGGVNDIDREDTKARAMRQEESWFRREYDYKGMSMKKEKTVIFVGEHQ